jgi:hypothetical protein
MVGADFWLDGGELRVGFKALDERGEPIWRNLHIAIEEGEVGHIDAMLRKEALVAARIAGVFLVAEEAEPPCPDGLAVWCFKERP